MQKPKVIIIGGGVSGLTTAYYLNKLKELHCSDLEVKLYEKTSRLGGIIRTTREDDFILEEGPDMFITEQPWALNLCCELGLESEIIPTQAQNRRSYLLNQGKLEQVPNGFYLMVPRSWEALQEAAFLNPLTAIRMMMERFIPATKDKEDESVAHFVRRRFGKGALESIAQPMLAGIYTGDPEKLSVSAAFPKLKKMEQEYGSLIKGFQQTGGSQAEASGVRYGLFVSLKRGMSSLIEALQAHIPNETIRRNVEITHVQKREKWEVAFSDGSTEEADSVVFTMPLNQTARLLNQSASDLAEELQNIRYASAAIVSMVFPRSAVKSNVKGFGFIVPEKENGFQIGGTFSHMKFEGRVPNDNWFLIRGFVGGDMHPEYLQLSDSEMIEKVLSEWRKWLEIVGEPVKVKIERYNGVMPQYELGHLKRIESIERKCRDYPGLHLLGTAFGGVGIPNCIRQARQTSVEILESFNAVATSEMT